MKEAISTQHPTGRASQLKIKPPTGPATQALVTAIKPVAHFPRSFGLGGAVRIQYSIRVRADSDNRHLCAGACDLYQLPARANRDQLLRVSNRSALGDLGGCRPRGVEGRHRARSIRSATGNPIGLKLMPGE